MAAFLIFWSVLCWLSALVGVLASFTAESRVGLIVAAVVATINSLQAIVAMIGAGILKRLDDRANVRSPVVASETHRPDPTPPGSDPAI